MIKRHKKLLNVLFLVLFLLITASINLFHTEKSPWEDPRCPACAFQHSSVATAEFDFFLLPTFSLLEIVKGIEFSEHTTLLTVSISARSPPAA
jgi:hypothetical protein